MIKSESTAQYQNPTIWNSIIVPWGVCLVAALFYAYDFFLRIAPSVMIHPLMSTFNIDATTIGLISAFYYYSYTPLQIPSGLVIDRFNIQGILVGSIVLCIAGALLFALVPSLPILYLARLMMGFGSAFAFSASLKLASRWLPKNQFAFFAGIATGLGTLGAVCADWILSRLVKTYGWQDAMLVTAYIGVAMGILIILFVRDKPKWLKTYHIPKASWKKSLLRLLIILRTPGFWYNGIVGSILFMPVNVVASLWGVSFLIQGKHYMPTEAASITALIFVGAAIGAPLSGWFSDYIKSRRIPLVIGTICVFVVTLLLVYTDITSHVAIYILLFLLGLFTGTQVLVFAIVREISPPHTTGISTAATNFVVTIAAAVFQPVIGVLLDVAWDGAKSATGVPLFNIDDYKAAFLVLPILTVIGFFMIFMIPKTHCKRLYEKPEDIEHIPQEKNPYYKRKKK